MLDLWLYAPLLGVAALFVNAENATTLPNITSVVMREDCRPTYLFGVCGGQGVADPNRGKWSISESIASVDSVRFDRLQMMSFNVHMRKCSAQMTVDTAESG